MLTLLSDRESCARIQEKLTYLAWRKHYIRREDSEDIIQTTITTYLEVRDRYGPGENHYGILLGIFQNKCLEFLDRRSKERQRLRAMSSKPDAGRENPRLDPDGRGATGSALQKLIREEEGREILAAIGQLRPAARSMFRLLVEQELGRKGLLNHYGVNKNTLDSRLRTFRMELKELLRQKGILT